MKKKLSAIILYSFFGVIALAQTNDYSQYLPHSAYDQQAAPSQAAGTIEFSPVVPEARPHLTRAVQDRWLLKT